MVSESILPFHVSIPDSDLVDLRGRLIQTRWPEREPVGDWSQGVPLSKIQELCAYWRDHYDWRRCERLINSWPQYQTTIDGLDIHFVHIRSVNTNAMPMIMTHGWPGSILEFRKVVGPLTNPVVHGGSAEDAFHLVIPSLPGYGFSAKPDEPGWGLERIARAWVTLMQRLGYHRYCAQGGDWGADITAQMGNLSPPGLVAVHMNSVFFDARREIRGSPTVTEAKALAFQEKYEGDEYGYFKLQGTRPQTIGYALADSPAGQAAWIYEKIWMWSSHDGDVEHVLDRDEILDGIMLYWLTNSGASSARLYWRGPDSTAFDIDIPVGISQFYGDLLYAPREWGERYYKNIVHWRELDCGGHFAAWEQPELFVGEVRDCFRHVRGINSS